MWEALELQAAIESWMVMVGSTLQAFSLVSSHCRSTELLAHQRILGDGSGSDEQGKRGWDQSGVAMYAEVGQEDQDNRRW